MLVHQRRQRGLALFALHDVANGARYRVGNLAAGAGALYLSDAYGWRAAYLCMAVLLAPGTIAALLAPEPPAAPLPPGGFVETVWAPIRDLLARLGPLAVRWYGLMYVAGFIAFIVMGKWRANRDDWRGVNAKEVDDMLLYAVVGVILNLAIWFSLHTLFGVIDERYFGWLRLHVPAWASLDPAAAAIAAGAVVATFVFHVRMLPQLAGCAALGIAWRLLVGAS